MRFGHLIRQSDPLLFPQPAFIVLIQLHVTGFSFHVNKFLDCS